MIRREDLTGNVERGTGFKPCFHVGAQRVARVGRVGQRRPAMPRDVTEDDGDSLVVNLEYVVKVTARGWPGSRAVGDRYT